MSRGSNLAHKIESAVVEPVIQKPSLSLVPGSSDPLEELFARKPIRQHIREFGHLLGLIGLLIGLYLAFQKGSIANAGAATVTSLLLISLCSFAPRAMLPVWRGWMAFAKVLERVSTTVILGLMWGGMMIPIGIILKIAGIRVMDMSYRADVKTYWLDIPPAKTDFKLLERQY